MTKYFLFIFFKLIVVFSVYSQVYLFNGSFEGNRGAGISPSGWEPCKQFSTPDTQPGSWNVTSKPSKGASYLGMVVRGDLGPYALTTEACQQVMDIPLVAGKKYLVSVDLAHSASFGHDADFGWLAYNRGAILRIWGGSSSCEMNELLAESGPVDNTNWKNFKFGIQTNGDYKYFILEAYFESIPEYFGNIIIDNITLKEDDGLIVNNCETIIPNLITPNGDSKNDSFLIQCLPENSTLEVYNRWGERVFFDSDYKNNWIPQGLSDGLYFYSLSSGMDKEWKGWVQLIGESGKKDL